MLRRKNNEVSYLQPRNDQSPYRFQRKNINLSPGLSPLRCRTPTKNAIKGNMSPIRLGGLNDNLRGHSPLKFLPNRTPNGQINGFFRNQNPQNQQNYNQKYAICTNNNDISAKRQSYYEKQNNSRIKSHYQNAQRMAIHQNTNLFSKLVSKLNSEKKKQTEIPSKSPKTQNHKPKQAHMLEDILRQQPKLAKLQSNPQPVLKQIFTDQIKPVQSVMYEASSSIVYSQTVTDAYRCKQNYVELHQQTYQIKQLGKQPATSTSPINSKDHYFEKKNQKNKQPSHKNLNNKTCQNSNGQKKMNIKLVPERNEDKSNQKYKQRVVQRVNLCENKISVKKTDLNQPQQSDFDDVRLYLDKLRESKAFFPTKNSQISQVFQNGSMNMSFMNMDPFI